MNKHPKLTVLSQEETVPPFTEETSKLLTVLAYGLEKWGKVISYALLGGALAMGAWSFYFAKSPQKIHQATEALEEGMKNLLASSTVTDQKEIISSLLQELHTNSELSPLYQGKIAQALIHKEQLNEIDSLTKPLFQRTHLSSYPLFEKYALSSLLIAKGELSLALEESLLLNQQLSNDSQTLKVWNLIRIAHLQERMSLPAAKETWGVISKMYNDKEIPKTVLDTYISGNNDLISFLKSRL